ncbi:TadE/TadG family type IV pilus assembly protein [Ferrimonas aestuarii]|uniref:Pilus assembly protein n=1 Tax=Ferrimonas aestuarii TaxID=2569539 RepID=A0A4U1BTF7_9GAMM|nr:TadE family protein [Ferrimonas aestuarii]TKB58472.1 pilus assembly protein [Ferrimonas aestuarii]
MKLAYNQRGVFSIEFALGSMLMILTSFAIFELSRFIYLVNLTETALSESVRDTKVVEGERFNLDYQATLQSRLETRGEIWLHMLDPSRFNAKLESYASLEDLAADLPSDNCARCPIVKAELSYDYQPIYYFGIIQDRQIRRTLLSIQEHEGWPDAQ